MIAVWVILMGIIGIGLVTILTIMVFAGLATRSKDESNGPSLAAILGVAVMLLAVGLLVPFGLLLLPRTAAVLGQTISVSTRAVHSASQLAYEGATLPTHVIQTRTPTAFMLLIAGGILFVVWMVSNGKTRAIGSRILSLAAVAILLGGGLLVIRGLMFQHPRAVHIDAPVELFPHEQFLAQPVPPWQSDLQMAVNSAHQAVAETRAKIDRKRFRIGRSRGGIGRLEPAVALAPMPAVTLVEERLSNATTLGQPPSASTAELADTSTANPNGSTVAAEVDQPLAEEPTNEEQTGAAPPDGDDAPSDDTSDEPAETPERPSDPDDDAGEDSAANSNGEATEPEDAQPIEAEAAETGAEAAGDAVDDAVQENANEALPSAPSEDASASEPKEDSDASTPAAAVATPAEAPAPVETPELPAGDVVVEGLATPTATHAPLGSSAPDDAVAPQPQPEWVKIPPKLVGNSYRRTAVSDPFSTDDECRVDLDGRMMVITYEYLCQLLGIDDSYNHSRVIVLDGRRRSRVPEGIARARLRNLGISPVYVRRHICKDEYIEHVGSSVDKMIGRGYGQMRQIHVLMEFDDAVQKDLKKRWKDSRLVERLGVVGGGALAIVALVGLLFAYLKFDTATKGYYTRWLQVAIGVVTILVVVALTAILG